MRSVPLSAAEAISAMVRGDVSCRELVGDCLDRIASMDSQLHAFITLADDALERAGEVDEEMQRKGPRGPLHGLPIAVKDLTRTRGLRTTFGATAFGAYNPAEDDLCVSRLRAAGAVILGKTNTPEFGCGPICVNPFCAATTNPYDLNLTSGGSSGGSAAAVAAGLVPIAHGTDLGGSIRMPASFCGILGIRPTTGRIPDRELSLSWDGMNVHGLFARTVDDLELALRSLWGADPSDPFSLEQTTFDPHPDSTLRLAYTPDFGVSKVHPAVAQAIEEAVARIARLCGPVEAVDIDCHEACAANDVIRMFLYARNFSKYVDQNPGRVSASLLENVMRGRKVSEEKFNLASAVRRRFRESFLKLLSRHQILLAPSTAILPYPNQPNETSIADTSLLSGDEYFLVTSIVSLLGFPALSVPCAQVDGLPVGLQLIAAPFQDQLLMSFARRLETELGFRHLWPSFGKEIIHKTGNKLTAQS